MARSSEAFPFLNKWKKGELIFHRHEAFFTLEILLTSSRLLFISWQVFYIKLPHVQQAVPLLSARGKKISISMGKFHTAKHSAIQLNGMVRKKPFLMRFHTFPHITHSRHHGTMQFLSPLSLPDVEKLISVANEWCIIFRFPHVTYNCPDALHCFTYIRKTSSGDKEDRLGSSTLRLHNWQQTLPAC